MSQPQNELSLEEPDDDEDIDDGVANGQVDLKERQAPTSNLNNAAAADGDGIEE